MFHREHLSTSANREEYLQSVARDGVQALVASLFSLPTKPSPDGPLAQLPPPTTALPRAKPLPKPKPLTKWEKFANAKGIQHKRREKKVWDEERQEWVDRWGWKGANKMEETQWLSEVPANAGQFSLLDIWTTDWVCLREMKSRILMIALMLQTLDMILQKWRVMRARPESPKMTGSGNKILLVRRASRAQVQVPARLQHLSEKWRSIGRWRLLGRAPRAWAGSTDHWRARRS